MIALSGMTWNHSRALPPLVACSQRFQETHPGVEIHWAARSLHEFGHAALDPLAAAYDLLVIDHPMMGAAHESGALLDLTALMPGPLLRDMAAHSVGASFSSYCYQGGLFALPVDAAAPAASYRPDLLERHGLGVPQTWSDLLQVARRGLAVMPGFHVDVLLNFLALCVTRGSRVPHSPDELVEPHLALESLETLRELMAFMPPRIYGLNPIATLELMAAGEAYAYCPFAFSYSNYAREGYAAHRLRFANPVTLGEGQPMRTVLGGTGLALSRRCAEPAMAAEFAAYAAGGECQRTLYALSGGQPAHDCAWTDPVLDLVTQGFFANTRDCLERAWVRPRYAGFVEFQAHAGVSLLEYLQHGGAAPGAREEINRLYRESRHKDSLP